MKEFNAEQHRVETALTLATVGNAGRVERHAAYVGLDVHKETIAVAVAEPGRAAQGELKLGISASRQATGEADPNGHPVNGRSAERARHGWRAPDLLAVQECTATQGLARFSGA
ncbi:MAG: hypothetical protein QNJ82_17505, partial [Gammaproteobacteria bacterium]|nr:hypothetical protein [Gammaproteobacteria bacterium]